MNPRVFLAILLLGLPLIPARGVQVLVNGTASYNTSDPTSSQVANWGTGWGASGIDGWDYVGTIYGASGVYVGNGWVLTAGHVGAGTFTLGGISYGVVPGSGVGFSTGTDTADLTLFQLTSSPDLPPLEIATSLPAALSYQQPGSEMVMIGYGGGTDAWGLNTVTTTSVLVQVEGYSYLTTDFATAYGTTTLGSHTASNNAVLIGGDSGGGDFVYDSATGQWQLAGINEAVDTTTHDSYMVQLDAYASQIKSFSAVPEPRSLLPTGIALALLAGRGVERGRRGASACSNSAGIGKPSR